MRSKKQELQQEYAWTLAEMLSAMGALERCNRFLTNSPIPWKFFVYDEEFIRRELKNAYEHAKRRLDTVSPKEKE